MKHFTIDAQQGETVITAVRHAKREAIRELHRAMRQLGEGAVGSVQLEGFGYVVQQRLERRGERLVFVNLEL
jgi:hypothetical protein